MSESVNHETSFYDYLPAHNYIAIYYNPIQTIVRSTCIYEVSKNTNVFMYICTIPNHTLYIGGTFISNILPVQGKKTNKQSESTSLYTTGRCNCTSEVQN